MADATVIVEGKIKFREGKKWKPRWCILKKPSPVADRLQVYLYKDLTEFAKNESKPKSVFALDGFFGLDAGFAYDREQHVLALICHKSISLMAFELRENMIQFEIKIRQNMGEEHQFPVKVVKAPSSARLPKDPVRLMIHSMRFCLIAHVPPKILIAWNIEDLRRFGTREGKFCFEGGTRCGKGSGVFALQSEQAEDIADIVNLASTGKLVNCHRKFKNRRRHSQVASYEMPDEISYSSVTVYIDAAQDDDGKGDDATQPDASPAACTLSHHVVNASDIIDCINPAKSILRPRSGQEYIFIQRVFLTSPVTFSCLPTNSSFVNSVFSELQKPHEELSYSYQTDPQSAIASQSISSHYLSLPRNTPQNSPSNSSGKETVRSSVSVHSPFWGPDPSHHRCEGRSHAKCVNDTSSLASTPHPVFSPHHGLSVSPTKSKSAHVAGTEDSIFFPVYMTFSATTPPPSPLGPYAHTSSAQHTPTYVNQEFVNRHNNASASSHTVSTSGSISANSPIRAGVQSLKSFIFKDSSRHSPRVSKETRTRSRHSESDANRIEKLSLSLPSSKHNEPSVSSSVQRSHSDPKRSDTEEKLHLPSGTMLSSCRELPQKVYDKFADSSIISRRRRRHGAGNNLITEAALIHSSAEPSLRDISREHSPVLKSSGYKNIDCMNAATLAASFSPSPRTPSAGPDTLHLSHTSQLGSILESRVSPSEIIHSPGSLVFVARNRHSSSFVFSGGVSDTVQHSVTLPRSSYPPPPVPARGLIPSSPSSSCSLNSAVSSSDGSQSPPSYFAPSPPCTRAPPALPPRMPQSSPFVMVSSSPLEPDTVSHVSEEGQQLNYIQIDLTKSTEMVVLPPPLANSRRSKRVRQQKEKDYAKLRYALIDHRATKALQQTRQEHEQCRDSNLRNIQPKDTHLDKTSHLSRINSAPASSKRKPISVMQRERKLSSGSIESC